MHGLYLLSAVARAEGDFEKAKTIALEALLLSQDELRAKVLFNLGAAEADDDPKGDLIVAQKSFEEALLLSVCLEDRQRTTIRLGKVYLLQGNIAEAKSLLGKILPEIQNKRIAMHAEYLSAQVEKALGDIEKARQMAQEALIKAAELGAAKDAERIKEFVQNL